MADGCHLVIGGAQFFVVFRATVYFRGLSIRRTVGVFPIVRMPFLRFAVSGLFGIVVRAGGAIDRHPDLLLSPVLTVHLATAHPRISWDMTRAYDEARSAKENT
jgi:hypothetical protein